MWNGEYKKWSPIKGLDGKRLDTEAIHDDWEGFRIWLRPHDNTQPMLIVKFDHALMYVNGEEGLRFGGVEARLNSDFPHTFWIVENSELIEQFHRQSANTLDDWEIVHYAFLSCNDIIDVLSVTKPAFVWE